MACKVAVAAVQVEYAWPQSLLPSYLILLSFAISFTVAPSSGDLTVPSPTYTPALLLPTFSVSTVWTSQNCGERESRAHTRLKRLVQYLLGTSDRLISTFSDNRALH